MGTIKSVYFKFIGIVVAILFTPSLFAQSGPDPVRATMFYDNAKQAKKALMAQDALLCANLTGHKYLSEEVAATTNFQRQFNNYLNQFDDILTVAANIYGIYMEVDEARKNLKVVQGIVVRQPANVLAVALSRSKNKIYTDLIEEGLKLAADVKQVLPLKKNKDKNAKMTQYERLKVMDKIRVNLRTLNRKLRTLSRLVHYTTIMDSWYDLKGTGKEYQPRKMAAVTKDCLQTWKKHAQSVKY
ncbi:hypothetical protein [Hallella colorans]|uniref:Uncharacterized protein n=1 Tax=Hallella colorans TaxID=1703337 RepID=A0A2U0TXY2_9BACT|nr:hypothetical protein [Hallella colorans]PVX48449.1 hypothetical protein C7379_12615 [Hallella colorans]